MELKYIAARDAKSAIEQATILYGRDVLIISSHQVGGQAEFVVAVDTEVSSPQIFAKDALRVQPDCQSSPNHNAAGEAVFGDYYFRAHAKLGKFEPGLHNQELTNGSMVAIGLGHSEKNDEIIQTIRDEVAALRRDFVLSQKASGWRSGLNLNVEVEALLASFTAAGMPTGLRTLLLHTVQDMQTEIEALNAVREQLNHAVGRPVQVLPQKGAHLLLGPSGVGKSLMVARLARHAASNKATGKVAVISYCDGPVGSWQQEHLNANVAGVDHYHAGDAVALGVLKRSMELSQEHELILIDTASSFMAQRVAEVQAVYPDCLAHAVLAADSSSAALNRTLQTSGISWASLMISKLDESVQPWPLVEFLCSTDLKLSAASDGFQAADLRFDFSAASLVEMALAQLTRIPEILARPHGEPVRLPIARDAGERAWTGAPMRLKFNMSSAQLRAPARPQGLRGPFN